MTLLAEPTMDAERALNERRETAVLACPDPAERRRLAALLAEEDLLVLSCPTAVAAELRIEEAQPDLLVLCAASDEVEVLRLLAQLRDDPDHARLPAIVLADEPNTRLRAFTAGADDVVARDVSAQELGARVRVRLERRPVPREGLIVDPVTGALTEAAFETRLAQEVERVGRGGRPGAIAYLSLHELPALQARLGSRARDEVLGRVVRLIEEDGRKLDTVAISRGHLVLLMPNTPPKGAQTRLERLSRKLSKLEIPVNGEARRFTPALGHAASAPGVGAEELQDRAWAAVLHAAEQLDLHPTRWRRELTESPGDERSGWRRRLRAARTPLQVAFQQALCFGLPFLTYFAMDRLGVDVSGWVFLALVVALALTAVGIWVECAAALKPSEPPSAPDGDPPPASALIAAYLPNEAGTVVETVETFLAQDYPDLQVILAYNTPSDMPVEATLREIADRDPRFLPLRVEGSVSKAQNVNAALARVTGEFVGVFDADHHPAPGSFLRAWR
jgi:GGDEF domain-containing protein